MRVPDVTRAAIVAMAIANSACGVKQPPAARLSVLFGPAMGNETISGRVEDPAGRALLMAGDDGLVTIELDARVKKKTTVQVRGRERCWGLGRLEDGSVWTLMGRNTAIAIGSDGGIVREVALAEPHFGLFAVGDRLVLQPARQEMNAQLLVAMRPGDPDRVPWSTLAARAFDRLATGAAAALNLVNCGTSQRPGETPCWFPYEPVLALISNDGVTKRVPLAGLPVPEPESLINASAPVRPIRDVYVERDGTIWVISTGVPRNADLPGGWLLARFGPNGEPIDSRPLPEPARVILRASSGRALVLTGAGMIAEVQP